MEAPPRQHHRRRREQVLTSVGGTSTLASRKSTKANVRRGAATGDNATNSAPGARFTPIEDEPRPGPART